MDTNLLLQMFYYIAIFSTLFFIIKTVMFTVFGGDGTEVVSDFNVEFDSDPSFSFFSIQSILAFFMAFGWSGYSAIKQFNLTPFMAILVSIIVGLIFMAAVAWLMMCVRKLEKHVKKDKTTALGKVGKAYTNFSPKGSGQIEIIINDQLTVADAVNTTDEEIKAFDNVKVVKVENDILYIEK